MNDRRTSDFDSKLWSIVWTGRYSFNFPQRQHPINHPSKYNVLSVQEIAFCRSDEELNSGHEEGGKLRRVSGHTWQPFV
jgi:hypothetical protein